MAKLDDKDLYDQVVQTYKYFLDWRAKLFVGYFAVLAALGYAFTWICERKLMHLLVALPVAGAFATLGAVVI